MNQEILKATLVSEIEENIASISRSKNKKLQVSCI